MMALMAWARDHSAAALIVLAFIGCTQPPERQVLEVAISPTTSALIPKPREVPPTAAPRAPDHGLGLSPEGDRAVEDLLHSDLFVLSSSMNGTPTHQTLAMQTLARERNAAAAALYVIKKGTLPGQLVGLMVLRTADPAAFKIQIRPFRNRTDKVKTGSGCIVGERIAVRDLMDHVENKPPRRPSNDYQAQDLHAAMKDLRKQRERERSRRWR